MLAGNCTSYQLLAACWFLALTTSHATAALPASGLQDVVAQALGSLPTSGGAGRVGRLRRSLQGAGFHRELHYALDVQPCGSRSGSVAGLWRSVATALRLPQRLGGCPTAAVGDTCEVALVQPLPAAVYADVDQLGNLAASRRGSPAALSFRLVGVADAERTEVECTPTALVLRWTAPIQRGRSDLGAAQQAGNAATVYPDDETALQSAVSAGHSIATQRAVPLHARYPTPVVGGGASGDASLWRASWKSPVVTTVLPWPSVRVRCGEGSADAAWEQVRLGRDAGDADRMTWRIPAGDLRHAVFVNVVTALAYLIGAAFVLRAVLKSTAIGTDRSLIAQSPN